MARQAESTVPLVISSSGLGPSELAMLTVAIAFVSNQGIKCRFIGNDNLKGHLVVVDADSDRGQESLTRLQQGQVKMLMARQPLSGKNIVSITKPLDCDELGALLARVCFRLQLQLEKYDKSAVARNTSEHVPDDEPTGLFSAMLDAKLRKQSLVVSHNDQPVLYVDGPNEVVKSALDTQALREVLAAPGHEVSITVAGDDVLSADWAKWQVMPLGHALWSAGLQWRGGGLLEGLHMGQPLKLKAWPNFTRADFSPEHLRLSALMAARAMSPSQLIETSGVDKQDVMCFINAAYAVGLLYVETQAEAVEEEKPPVKDDRRQGMLAKLARRLGF